jgi:hypothetical protein
MKSRRIAACVAGLFVAVAHTATAQDKLVYADFEAADGQPVSARGGAVTITSYQESDLHKTTIKGAPGSNRPELVRIKPDDPNRLAKFDFTFMAPNSWAGAGFEIKGQADADGKTPADDVSGYRKITFQLYGKGVDMVRVEAVSRGHGLDVQAGWPQMSFKVRPGLNTYEVALNALAQPQWVETKIDARKFLQKLTALNITAYCEPCRPSEGLLLVDNVAFEK